MNFNIISIPLLLILTLSTSADNPDDEDKVVTLLFENKPIFLHARKRTFWQAQAICAQNGQDLLSLDTEAEFDYLSAEIKKLTKPGQAVWIGLIKFLEDKTAERWHWLGNGLMLDYSKWCKDAVSKPESYAALNRDFECFNRAIWVEKKVFVCQYQAHVAPHLVSSFAEPLSVCELDVDANFCKFIKEFIPYRSVCSA